MADKKISALTVAATPLAGTEVLPIVQSSTTKQVSVANLTDGRAVSALSITTNNTGYATPTANFQSGDQAGARVAIINSGAGGQTYHLVTGNPGVSNSGFALYDSTNSATRLYVGSSTGDLTLNTGNLVQGTAAKGVNFTANTPLGGKTSQLLNYYEEGTWTPSVGNLTVVGTPTYTGKYTRIGRQVTIVLRIQSTVSTASALGTTYFSLPISATSTSTLTAVQSLAGASYGVGLVYTDGNAYTPTWGANADVTISATYFV